MAGLSEQELELISALSSAEAIAAYEDQISQHFEREADRGEAFRELGYRWEVIDDIDRAYSAYDRSVKILEKLPLSSGLVYSLGERSYATYTRTGDESQYCPDRERALTVARAVGEGRSLVHALVRRAFCFESSADPQRGLVDLQEAMEIAQESKLEESTLAMVANASGNLYRKLQLHDRAYTAFVDAYQLWSGEEDAGNIFNMLHNMVGELIQMGQWEQAGVHVDEMFELASTPLAHSDFLFFAHFNRGHLMLAKGEYALAESSFTEALAIKESTSESHFVAEAYLERAEARVWLQKLVGAREDLRSFTLAGAESNAMSQLFSRLNQALEANSAAQIITAMLELRQREAEKRYAFINSNTRLFTREHEQRIATYEASLLKQTLALRDLELKRAEDKATLARQSIVNLALLALLLCGLVVWLFHSLRQHRTRAYTDFLTGIATRGRIFELGFGLCEKAQKRGDALAVILLDIDNFKRINDRFGHGAGDKAIQRAVQGAESAMGKGGLIGRLGGEEFLVVLPGCNMGEARLRAEAIRTAVSETGFLHAGKHAINFTVSLGVACLGPNDDFQGIVNDADMALYRAKQAGRDRVAVAGEDTAADIGVAGVVGSRKAPRPAIEQVSR